MRRSSINKRPHIRFTVTLLVIATMVGCGFVTSAPWIRSASNDDEPNIEAITMGGGGNDILAPAIAFDPYDCRTRRYASGELSQSCKDFINDLYVDVVNQLNDMAADGVENVNIIYQGSYHTKNRWLEQLDSLEEAIDYGDMMLSKACQNSTVDCMFIDPPVRYQ
ncbi:MAG: hypothetical protein PVI60_09825 [Desulfobacteraceae bacterium]